MKKISFLLLVTLVVSIKMYSQESNIILLESVTPLNKNYSDVLEKLKPSYFFAFPIEAEDYIEPNDFWKVYDYVFPLSHSYDFTEIKNQFKFRLKINRQNQVKILFDTDMDNSFSDESLVEFNNRTDTFNIINDIFFKIEILDFEKVINNELGGVSMLPLTFYKGILKIGDLKQNIHVKNDILGVSIFMDSIYYDAKKLNSVKLEQGFCRLNKECYLFYDFNINKPSLKFKKLNSIAHLKGSSVGYNINLESLRSLVGRDLILGEFTIFYFWGVWCKPCIANFHKTLELKKNARTNNINMYFCSYDMNKEDEEKSKEFIKGKVNQNNILNLLASNEKNVLSNWYSEKSITNMMGIRSFPTYVVINKNGKILFKDNILDEEKLNDLIGKDDNTR